MLVEFLHIVATAIGLFGCGGNLVGILTNKPNKPQ